MRLVVLGVEQLALVPAKSVPNGPVLIELFLDPQRTGHQEGLEAARGDAEVRLENPFELDQGLVVKPDVVEVVDADSAFAQAVRHGPFRKGGVALLPGEPLLGAGRDNLAIAQQAGGAVVVKGRDPESMHRLGQASVLGVEVINPQWASLEPTCTWLRRPRRRRDNATLDAMTQRSYGNCEAR